MPSLYSYSDPYTTKKELAVKWLIRVLFLGALIFCIYGLGISAKEVSENEKKRCKLFLSYAKDGKDTVDVVQKSPECIKALNLTP